MSETMDSATQTYDEPELGSGAPDPDKGSTSPRVEIDTSAPFGSVEEAVIRFGGRGFWIPRNMLHSAPSDDSEEFDIYKLEEQAAEMLKDLDTKQQETLGILKELELTKRLIEELKIKLQKEASEFVAIPPSNIDGQIHAKKDPANDQIKSLNCSSFFPLSPAGLVMMELKQAKLNLSQSTNDLEAIRASVEYVNKKMEKKNNSLRKAQERQPLHGAACARELSLKQKLDQVRVNLQSTNEAEALSGNASPLGISKELRELNYEAEQFMKTAEAAKAEVLKAMSDIEQTKTGLKMIEMRWVAAKKLEEAAKAAEALALAEIKALSGNEITAEPMFQQKPGRISLSFEEYSSLAEKARKADNLFASSEFDGMVAPRGKASIPRTDPFGKLEGTTDENLSEMALREFMNRVEAANRRNLAEETLRRFGAETHQRNRPSVNNPQFRNFFPSQRRRDSRLLDANELSHGNTETKPVLRPTTSIGDILSRKLVLRDDLDIGRQGEGREDKQRVSLNQMLHRHRSGTPPPTRNEKNNGGGGESKSFFSKRKALGFVHISLPLSKQSKNRIQALNLW